MDTTSVLIIGGGIGGLATACPNSATCCDITITTTKGTVNYSMITLMLVSY